MSDRPSKPPPPPPLVNDESMTVPSSPRSAAPSVPKLSVPRPSRPDLMATAPKKPSSRSLATVEKPPDPTMTPLKPMPIITVGPMADSNEETHESAAPEDAPRAASGIDVTHDEGWTPYEQPPVAETADVKPPTPAPAPPEDAPEIPVDVATEEEEAEPARTPSSPGAKELEEISFDPERITDPSDVHEVGAEDFVSVEPAPLPKPPPTRPPSSRALAMVAPAFGASATPSAITAPPPVVVSGAPSAHPPAATPQEPVPPPSSAPPSGMPIPASAGTSLFVPPVGMLAIAPPPMSEAAANRKRIRPWWEELFNDDFIRTMAKVTDQAILREVDFIEESLGCQAGAAILDLACGTGRHAVELAARGYQVVGFDLSLAMLARASDEAQERKQKINFVQGDMREMLFDEAFDGIYAWNTSFGFFDEEKNHAVIGKVHKALKKSGQFLLDVVNRDYVIRQTPSSAWFEGDGCICMDDMQIDFITSRMKVKRTLMMDNARAKEIEYSIRIYSLHELGKMLHDNGFRVAEVSGSVTTPGVFFGCEAARTLILAEKR